MRIEYKNNFFDFLNFYLVTRFRSPFFHGIFAFYLLIIFITNLAEKGALLSGVLSLLYYIMFLLFVGIGSLFEAVIKSNAKYNHSHIIELQDDALYEETIINRSYFKFEGIYKLVFTDRVSVVFVAPTLAFSYQIVALSLRQKNLNF